MDNLIRLSICIATYNRGQAIGTTLDSIVNQIEHGVEVIIVDGASTDNTPHVIEPYVARYPQIHYYREAENLGVDRDYDKAVGYAKGEYCWLMTDDDLMKSNAVSCLLRSLEDSWDLLLVNIEIRNMDGSRLLQARRLDLNEDREYGENERETFFSQVGDLIVFIGCVAIRRDVWIQRDRRSYYGTFFIHVGVIFQSPPLKRIKIISSPLIIYRNGSISWTSRSFEIWMYKWPQLIWAFSDYSDQAKLAVCPREPYQHLKRLFFLRSLGSYTLQEYRRFIAGRAKGVQRMMPYLIALFPVKAANFLASLHCVLFKKRMQGLDNLLNSPHATRASRFIGRFVQT